MAVEVKLDMSIAAMKAELKRFEAAAKAASAPIEKDVQKIQKNLDELVKAETRHQESLKKLLDKRSQAVNNLNISESKRSKIKTKIDQEIEREEVAHGQRMNALVEKNQAMQTAAITRAMKKQQQVMGQAQNNQAAGAKGGKFTQRVTSIGQTVGMASGQLAGGDVIGALSTGLSSSMNPIAQTAGIIVGVLQGLGTALDGMGAKYREFEGAFNKLKVALDPSEWDRLDEIQLKLEKISVGTATAATEMAAVAQNALNARVATADNVDEYATAVAQFAKVAGTQASTAEGFMSDVMRTWNKDVGDMTDMLDKFDVAMDVGQVSMETLQMVMGKASTSSQALGLGFEDLTAMITSFGAQGKNIGFFQRAIDSMTMAFNDSAKVSKLMSLGTIEGFDKINRKITDSQAFFGSLQKIYGENKEALLDIFPGPGAMKSFEVLFDTTGKGFADMLSQVKTAGGSFRSEWTAIETTDQFVIDRMNQRWEASQRAIGETFSNISTQVRVFFQNMFTDTTQRASDMLSQLEGLRSQAEAFRALADKGLTIRADFTQEKGLAFVKELQGRMGEIQKQSPTVAKSIQAIIKQEGGSPTVSTMNQLNAELAKLATISANLRDSKATESMETLFSPSLQDWISNISEGVRDFTAQAMALTAVIPGFHAVALNLGLIAGSAELANRLAGTTLKDVLVGYDDLQGKIGETEAALKQLEDAGQGGTEAWAIQYNQLLGLNKQLTNADTLIQEQVDMIMAGNYQEGMRIDQMEQVVRTQGALNKYDEEGLALVMKGVKEEMAKKRVLEESEAQQKQLNDEIGQMSKLYKVSREEAIKLLMYSKMQTLEQAVNNGQLFDALKISSEIARLKGELEATEPTDIISEGPGDLVDMNAELDKLKESVNSLTENRQDLEFEMSIANLGEIEQEIARVKHDAEKERIRLYAEIESSKVSEGDKTQARARVDFELQKTQELQIQKIRADERRQQMEEAKQAAEERKRESEKQAEEQRRMAEQAQKESMERERDLAEMDKRRFDNMLAYQNEIIDRLKEEANVISGFGTRIDKLRGFLDDLRQARRDLADNVITGTQEQARRKAYFDELVSDFDALDQQYFEPSIENLSRRFETARESYRQATRQIISQAEQEGIIQTANRNHLLNLLNNEMRSFDVYIDQHKQVVGLDNIRIDALEKYHKLLTSERQRHERNFEERKAELELERDAIEGTVTQQGRLLQIDNEIAQKTRQIASGKYEDGQTQQSLLTDINNLEDEQIRLRERLPKINSEILSTQEAILSAKYTELEYQKRETDMRLAQKKVDLEIELISGNITDDSYKQYRLTQIELEETNALLAVTTELQLNQQEINELKLKTLQLESDQKKMLDDIVKTTKDGSDSIAQSLQDQYDALTKLETPISSIQSGYDDMKKQIDDQKKVIEDQKALWASEPKVIEELNKQYDGLIESEEKLAQIKRLNIKKEIESINARTLELTDNYVFQQNKINQASQTELDNINSMFDAEIELRRGFGEDTVQLEKQKSAAIEAVEEDRIKSLTDLEQQRLVEGFDKAMGYINAASDLITTSIDAIGEGDLSATFESVTAAAGNLAGAFGPVGKVVGGIISGFGKLAAKITKAIEDNHIIQSSFEKQQNIREKTLTLLEDEKAIRDRLLEMEDANIDQRRKALVQELKGIESLDNDYKSLSKTQLTAKLMELAVTKQQAIAERQRLEWESEHADKKSDRKKAEEQLNKGNANWIASIEQQEEDINKLLDVRAGLLDLEAEKYKAILDLYDQYLQYAISVNDQQAIYNEQIGSTGMALSQSMAGFNSAAAATSKTVSALSINVGALAAAIPTSLAPAGIEFSTDQLDIAAQKVLQIEQLLARQTAGEDVGMGRLELLTMLLDARREEIDLAETLAEQQIKLVGGDNMELDLIENQVKYIDERIGKAAELGLTQTEINDLLIERNDLEVKYDEQQAKTIENINKSKFDEIEHEKARLNYLKHIKKITDDDYRLQMIEQLEKQKGLLPELLEYDDERWKIEMEIYDLKQGETAEMEKQAGYQNKEVERLVKKRQMMLDMARTAGSVKTPEIQTKLAAIEAQIKAEMLSAGIDPTVITDAMQSFTEQRGFEEGGYNTKPGLAMLHGTEWNPEVILPSDVVKTMDQIKPGFIDDLLSASNQAEVGDVIRSYNQEIEKTSATTRSYQYDYINTQTNYIEVNQSTNLSGMDTAAAMKKLDEIYRQFPDLTIQALEKKGIRMSR